MGAIVPLQPEVCPHISPHQWRAFGRCQNGRVHSTLGCLELQGDRLGLHLFWLLSRGLPHGLEH